MARPPRTDRPVEKNISLPTSLVVQVELELYSEVEGKVPFGAWGKYVERLIREDLARRKGGGDDIIAYKLSPHAS